MEIQTNKYYCSSGDSSYYVLYLTENHTITIKYSENHKSYDLVVVPTSFFEEYGFGLDEYADFMDGYDEYLLKNLK